jgi:hypothetical protein
MQHYFISFIGTSPTMVLKKTGALDSSRPLVQPFPTEACMLICLCCHVLQYEVWPDMCWVYFICMGTVTESLLMDIKR